jgi:ketosteroid isomerase-like protein
MSDAEMTPELIAFVMRQKDRQEIHDCLLRYSRGVDRADKALMMSAYHPDALDEHGIAQGGPEEFCDWAIGYHGEHQIQHQHIVANHTVDLDGDVAHAETYYVLFAENRQGPPSLSFGRYVDRLEKRDGVWAIAHRVCVNEKTTALVEIEMPEPWGSMLKSAGPSRRDRDDISYDRPLRGSRGA